MDNFHQFLIAIGVLEFSNLSKHAGNNHIINAINFFQTVFYDRGRKSIGTPCRLRNKFACHEGLGLPIFKSSAFVEAHHVIWLENPHHSFIFIHHWIVIHDQDIFFEILILKHPGLRPDHTPVIIRDGSDTNPCCKLIEFFGPLKQC